MSKKTPPQPSDEETRRAGKKSSNKSVKYEFVPEMVSTSELQRGAGRVIDAVREGGEPYYVVRNNTPQAVLLSLEEYEDLQKKKREWEMKDTLEAIAEAEKEIKMGEIKEFKGNFVDLWEDLQDDEKKD